MPELKKTRSLLQLLLKQLTVAVFYFVLAQLVLRFFSDNGVVTMVYPPSGFALAILLIGGKRYFWAVFLGAFSSNSMLSPPVPCAAMIGMGNALSALCGAWLLTRNNQPALNLNKLRDYLRLLFWGGAVSCGVAAFIGSSSLLFFGIISSEKYVENLRHWWMGDGLGIVLAAPLILVLWQNKNLQIKVATALEALVSIGLTLLTGQVVFLNWFHQSIGQVARGYWMFLFITWIAVRLGTRGVVSVLAIISTQALVGAGNHVGFFADDIAKTNLSNYWFYMVILSLVGMALAIYVNERIQAERELQQYRLHLEQLVEERTAQLLNAKQAAEAANIAKSTFIATMSHELRTPLNAILGFSELMSWDENTTPKQKQTLDIINRSGAHLLSMINDVLDISKIEAGQQELNVQAFDLIKLLHDIGDMIKFRAADKQLSFRLEIDADTQQYIEADSGKLRQVLINLLGNAIKFTDQGGVVLRVHAQKFPDAAMMMLNMEVADSGTGIAADQQEKLFRPFVQLAQENSEVKGTGLGLAISKSLIELMGGRISVESHPGVGSTFKIELPVPVANMDEIATTGDWWPVKRIAPQQPEWRLLVVDDNPENRLLLASLLTKVGFLVHEAQNGEQAIAAFEQWHPDLIWMDMRMPVMDGYEATAKIRHTPGGEQVKIIALTASAFKEQHDDIIGAGCDAVIHKPFRTPEIFSALTQYLGIEFVYQHEAAVASAADLEISAEMLTQLPVELRQQLHTAALNLDMEETEIIIGQIRNTFPKIAAGLQQLAEHYQFEEIIQLTEAVI